MNSFSDDEENVDHRYSDNYQTNNFIDNYFNDQSSGFDDCFLSKDALDDFLSPSQETWKDFLSEKNEAFITMDGSKAKQWELAKKEIKHIRRRINDLVPEENRINDSVQMKDLVKLYLGPESKIGIFLQEELDLDKETYRKWSPYPYYSLPLYIVFIICCIYTCYSLNGIWTDSRIVSWASLFFSL